MCVRVPVLSVSACLCLRVHVHVTVYPVFLRQRTCVSRLLAMMNIGVRVNCGGVRYGGDIWRACGRGRFSIRRGTHIMQQIVWSMFLRKQVPLGMKGRSAPAEEKDMLHSC